MFGWVKVGIQAAAVVALEMLIMVITVDRQIMTIMEMVLVSPEIMAVLVVMAVDQEIL